MARACARRAAPDVFFAAVLLLPAAMPLCGMARRVYGAYAALQLPVRAASRAAARVVAARRGVATRLLIIYLRALFVPAARQARPPPFCRRYVKARRYQHEFRREARCASCRRRYKACRP